MIGSRIGETMSRDTFRKRNCLRAFQSPRVAICSMEPTGVRNFSIEPQISKFSLKFLDDR